MKRFLCFVLVLCMVSAGISAFAQSAVFSDVNETDWFSGDVEYVYKNKLMNGTSDTEFSPNGKATRGMIVTILWRLEGEPILQGREFLDVANDAYYKNAVSWASANGIVGGYSETEFGPEDSATREQLAAIIYRYVGYKKYDLSKVASLDAYKDKGEISDYAVECISWATANGIISGTSSETLSPKDFVTRCQIAAILKRLCENIISKDKTEEEPAETPVEPEEKPEVEKTQKEEESTENENINQENPKDQGGQTEVTKPTEDPSEETPKDEPENVKGTEIFVADASAKAGEEVTVFVNVKNNPGILGMVLAVYYDESKCTLLSAESGDVFKDILNLTTSKNLKSGARFVWDGLDISDKDIKDGHVLALTFKILDSSIAGSCPIDIEIVNNDIIDKNLDTIYPTLSGGYITVVSD